MNTNIQSYVTRSSRLEWMPLIEEGVQTDGIFVKVLRQDNQTERAPSIQLKFEAGAAYPYHNHPAGEEILVLEGSCMIEGTKLTAGDYLYTPPGGKHSVKSESGCILFLMIPDEVEIL